MDEAAVELTMVYVLPSIAVITSKEPFSVKPPTADAPENVTQVPADRPCPDEVTVTSLEPLVVVKGLAASVPVERTGVMSLY